MTRACSSVDRVPGYEPVGRRFESCMARHQARSVYAKVWIDVLFVLFDFCLKVYNILHSTENLALLTYVNFEKSH